MHTDRLREEELADRMARTRVAILLSTLGCPGLGQWVQRRWVIGSFFLTVFLGCVTMLFVVILVPLFANLNAILSFAEHGENRPLQPIPFVRILIWLSLSLVVYGANVADVITAGRRQRCGSAPVISSEGAE